MNDQEGVVEYRLDTLTRSVRFAAGIAPKTATKVSLGIALAIEDSTSDPAGELLAIKLHQGASALASGIGSIASSVRDRVRSSAQRLGAEDGLVAKVPAIENAGGFVTQAVSEVRDSWASAGHIAVQAEEASALESGDSTASPVHSELVPSTDASEEVND